MNLIKIYEKETGEKAMYRKGCSDYHTLEYVIWLEAKINNDDLIPIYLRIPCQICGRNDNWNCKRQCELQG